MFTNKEPFKDLERNKLITKMTTHEYAKYVHVELHKEYEGEDDIKVNISLVIRTVDDVLRTYIANDKMNDLASECLDVRCYLPDRNPNSYINNYPNVISRIADNLLDRYKIPREVVAPNTCLEPLGVIYNGSEVFWVFELFVTPEIFNVDPQLWVDIKELQKDFKSNSYSDTMIIPSLKTIYR